MRWRRIIRTLTHLDQRGAGGDSADAVKAADQSHARAVKDRIKAAETRAVAEQLEAQIHRHNTANRFDTWLQDVMRGGAS